MEFIRKRDKRVIEQRKKLEAKSEENKRKAEENRKKQIEKRNKELENYCESEWSSMSVLEHELKEIEERLDNDKLVKNGNKRSEKEESDSNNELDNLYCIACDKTFKSEKAFANHENSKKHKINVATLKSVLEQEDNLSNSC